MYYQLFTQGTLRLTLQPGLAARTYVPCFANALTYNQIASSIGADEHNGEPARAGATHAGLHRA